MSKYLPEPAVVPVELRRRRYSSPPKATFTHSELADMRRKGVIPSEVCAMAAKNTLTEKEFDARKSNKPPKPVRRNEVTVLLLRFKS